ncbi:mediator of RNA polymerase II transcription subunit 9 [Sceloporus undulatus]|uniref:mediator of RNA polymerase II transcription subunit 9 n=1 Tax=Sceloporus undulatus TaxID=8520 RepID=UPI001C4BCD49|nr:mediator of RNA polymerase II transcription subunit 9 [Sceloporus undulatus]
MAAPGGSGPGPGEPLPAAAPSQAPGVSQGEPQQPLPSSQPQPSSPAETKFQPPPPPPPPPPPQPPSAQAPPGQASTQAPPAAPPGQEEASFLPLVHDIIKCMDKESQDVHQVLNELRTKFVEMRKLIKSMQGIGLSPEQQQLQLQSLREQVKTKSELLQKYKSLCMFEIPKE